MWHQLWPMHRGYGYRQNPLDNLNLSPLETLLTLVRFPNMISDSFDRTLRGHIQEVKPEWAVAATRQPYREELDKLLAAQESTPAKIEEYLARPRWGSLFLRVDRWARRRGQR